MIPRRLVAVAAVAAVAALGACGGAGRDATSTAETAVRSSTTVGLQGSGGGSELLLTVGDTHYHYSCDVPRPEALGGTDLPRPSDERYDAARAIPSTPAEVAVAVHQAAREPCDTTLDGWVLVFSSGDWDNAEDASAYAEAVCELPVEPTHHLCPEGGPFYFEPPPGERENDAAMWAWSPSAVARANDALARGEPNPHRTPIDAVALEIDFLQDELYPDGFLYRAGLILREESVDRARVDLIIHQGLLCSGTKPCWDGSSKRYDLERLGGRPGWWTVGTKMVDYGALNVDPSERDRLNELWTSDCCDRVLVELERDPGETLRAGGMI